jgi:hypothetical protein
MEFVNVVVIEVAAAVAAADITNVVAFVILATVAPAGIFVLTDITAPTLIPAVKVVVAVVLDSVVVTASEAVALYPVKVVEVCNDAPMSAVLAALTDFL